MYSSNFGGMQAARRLIVVIGISLTSSCALKPISVDSCKFVGKLGDESSIPQMKRIFEANDSNYLVIAKNFTYICPPCTSSGGNLGGTGDGGKLGGSGDDNRLGGAGDDSRLGGSGGNARLGGAGDDSRLGGDDDLARLGGKGDDARLDGAGEDSRLGGDDDLARLGGNADDARLGGNGDGARLGGDGDDSRLGGNASGLACATYPGDRYRILNPQRVPLNFFDGYMLDKDLIKHN